MRRLALALLLALPAVAAADEVVTLPFDGTPADADFVVSSAIEAEGLVIDFVSHVGEMMARTGADLGLGPSPVGEDARSYLFCSATISREVMEADPTNMAHCPYAIFVAEIDGETVVGHKRYAAESMAPVNDLLARIAAAATE
jgi:hypothetical protein